MAEKTVLSPKVHATGLMDIGLLGVSKKVTEGILTPVIGNASTKSGVVKILGGALINGLKGGKLTNIVGGGLVIDGVEDVIAALGGRAMGGEAQQGAW